jgi:hypothetical protein
VKKPAFGPAFLRLPLCLGEQAAGNKKAGAVSGPAFLPRGGFAPTALRLLLYYYFN